MNQKEVYQFVEKYLRAQNCQIIAQGKNYITTKLSVHADQDIAGRPLYWLFQERTGAKPETLTLTFIFEQNKDIDSPIEGELLQFGSWRLHQILRSAQKYGQFIRLYEQIQFFSSHQALIPWLLVNYKISFISDQKKDVFYPLGLNLITGHILTQFDSILNNCSLTPKIPDFHFTLSPLFSLTAATRLLEVHIRQFLKGEDDTWAKKANQRLDEEVEIIQSFFLNESDSAQLTLNKRLQEVEYYRPRIEVKPINVGLIYLQNIPRKQI